MQARVITGLAITSAFFAVSAAGWEVQGPAVPEPHEKTALDEVRAYLSKRVGDHVLAVDGETDIVIHVGDTDFAKAKGITSEKVENERWLIKSYGRDVVINGGGTRGCLYGAYHFIEDQLGVRFWSETEEDVPAASALDLPRLDRSQKPFFAYRDFFRSMNGEKATSLFAIRRRQNRNGEVPVPAELGGALRYGPPNHCHTFVFYADWDKLGRTHPEYFALREGVRVGGRSYQLCLSNPDLEDLFYQKLLEYIAKGDAEAEKRGVTPPVMYDISMNDTPARCTCGECAAAEKKMGASGFYLDFVNRLARRIKKVRPEIRLTTLAYYFAEALPGGGARPEDNVIIKLCDTRSNQAASILEPQNGVFRELLGQWSGFAKNIVVWDYAVTYSDRTRGFPFASEFHLGDLYAFYATNNVQGIFWEHEQQEDGDLYDIKYYLESRLFEDPFQDADKLLSRAMKEYFGPAAPVVGEIRRHLDTIRRERQGFVSWTPELGAFDFITADDTAKMLQEFDEAEAAVKDDAKFLRRVKRLRKGTQALVDLRATFAKFKQGDSFVFDAPDLDMIGAKKNGALKLVDDAASFCGKAVRVDVDSSREGYYDLPFMIGVFDATTRKTLFRQTFPKPLSTDGYAEYTLKDVVFPQDSFVFITRSWTVQRQTGIAGLKDGTKRDVTAVVRFEGPKFFSGDTRTNTIFVSRLVIR